MWTFSLILPGGHRSVLHVEAKDREEAIAKAEELSASINARIGAYLEGEHSSIP